MAQSPRNGILYQILSQLGGIKSDITNLKENVDKETELQKTHRNSTTEVFTAQMNAFRSFTHQWDTWKERWDREWEPFLEELRQKRDEAIGRTKLGKAVLVAWTAVAAFAAVLVHKLWDKFIGG